MLAHRTGRHRCLSGRLLAVRLTVRPGVDDLAVLDDGHLRAGEAVSVEIAVDVCVDGVGIEPV